MLKPFTKIAVPHRDVIENTFLMKTFAADLWEAYKGIAPEEYSDPRVFFSRTYLTEGLRNLIEVVEKRVKNGIGDPVIQLQTPFGGGKTHALITLMHKAREEWNAKTIVVVGTNPDAREQKIWEIIEEQLTGKVEILKGNIAPGKDKLKKVLSENQPVLILMDELLEYLIKASGVDVGESTLAAQTIAFMQELSEVVVSLPNTALVVTLPSSTLEHYDERGERLHQQLQKVVGRVEKIYSPIDDEEVSMVIRRRLFKSLDEMEMEKVVNYVVDYLKEKDLFKKLKIEPKEYRERFMKSYPFQPEVIDTLYHKWGSYPNFQRTRGVLRLLALVVHSLINSQIPYISLGDFELSNQDIRQELIKFAGQEFNSIIAQDITAPNSGSKKVDSELGSSNIGLKLGTRTSTVIFMNSFSGGGERGAYTDEIVISATTVFNEPSIIHEALNKLSTELFYLQTRDGKYFFQNQPNLNKIHINKMENIDISQIEDTERNELVDSLKNSTNFRVFIWESKSESISDTQSFKLIVLKRKDPELIREMINYKGSNNFRVYKNTLFFLVPDEMERIEFHKKIREMLGWKAVLKDSTLNLKESDIEEVNQNIHRLKRDINEMLLRVYRFVLVPSNVGNEGFIEEKIGPVVYGMDSKLESLVYECLKENGAILTKTSEDVIFQKYLKDKEYEKTMVILENSYKVPGEIRFANMNVLKDAIESGIRSGKLCLGIEKNGNLELKDNVLATFNSDEVIIKKEKCETLKKQKPISGGSDNKGGQAPLPPPPTDSETPPVKKRTHVELRNLKISKTNSIEIVRLAKSLLEHFENVSITIEASKGSIPEETWTEYYEQLKNLGIVVEDN